MINALLRLTFLKFLIAGGISYLVDFSVLTISTYLIFGGKNLIIFEIISVPQVIASFFGLTSSFLLNKIFVFKKREGKVIKEILKFIVFSIINALIAGILFTIFYYIYTPLIISYPLLLFLSSISKEISKMFISFFFYKNFIFK